MNYNIENTNLTDRELEVVKKNADNKLIDILSTLADSGNNVFYGNMMMANFKDRILSVNDKLSEIDDLLRSLESKSDDEIKDLAKKYNVKNYEELNKSLLRYEVEKAIYLERNSLRDESIEVADTYTKNYKNTFEYFIKEKIDKLQSIDEHNLELKAKYDLLLKNFKEIKESLEMLHSWIDVVTYPCSLLEQYESELTMINERIIDNQTNLAISTSYSEMKSLSEAIKAGENQRELVLESIDILKKDIIKTFKTSNIQINFANLKLKIFNNLEYIKSNMYGANDVIGMNEEDIDKVMKAFAEFFSLTICREYDFRNYLIENNIVLSDEHVQEKEFVAEETKENKVTFTEEQQQFIDELIKRIKIKEDAEHADELVKLIYERGYDYAKYLSRYYDDLHMKYDELNYSNSSKGVIFVVKDGMMGAINKNDEVILPLEFYPDFATLYDTWVKTGYAKTPEEVEYNLKRHDLKDLFKDIYSETNGLSFDDSLYSLIDKLANEYDDFEYASSAEGIILVKKNDLWGAINKEGEIIVPCSYSNMIEVDKMWPEILHPQLSSQSTSQESTQSEVKPEVQTVTIPPAYSAGPQSSGQIIESGEEQHLPKGPAPEPDEFNKDENGEKIVTPQQQVTPSQLPGFNIVSANGQVESVPAEPTVQPEPQPESIPLPASVEPPVQSESQPQPEPPQGEQLPGGGFQDNPITPSSTVIDPLDGNNPQEEPVDYKTLPFRDKFIYLCNLMGDEMVFKVKATKETITDRLSVARAKAKKAIQENKVFKKIKQTINDTVDNAIQKYINNQEGRTK